MPDIEIEYQFFPLGAKLPENPKEDEIWINLGDRIAPRIIDHHGGSEKYWSCSQIVQERQRELIIDPFQSRSKAILILRSQIDIDAVFSAWLITQILKHRTVLEPDKSLMKMLDAVNDNEQGYTRFVDAVRSWATVMKASVFTFNNGDSILKEGFKFLDRSYRFLCDGMNLEEVSETICTKNIRIALSTAHNTYLEDLSRSTRFQLRLPLRNFEITEDKEDIIDDLGSWKWGVADAVFLREPQSILFKEFARNDHEHSLQGNGFALMVVSRKVHSELNGSSMYHHVISTDPWSGFHLRGLGETLEALEQDKEIRENLPLHSGRERVEFGKGRHGSNVASPWYDGRGHHYTIIDSPAISVETQAIYASNLLPEEVLNALWNHGDPSRFMNVEEAQLTVYIPLKSDVILSGKSEPIIPKTDRLMKEMMVPARSMLEEIIYRPSTLERQRIDNLEYITDEIWTIEPKKAVSVSRFEIKNIKTIYDLLVTLHNMSLTSLIDILPNKLLDSNKSPSFLISCRLKTQNVNLIEEEGLTRETLSRLTKIADNHFSDRCGTHEQIDMLTAISQDEQHALFVGEKCAVQISVGEKSFSQENGFYSPENIAIVQGVVLLQNTILEELYSQFVTHRNHRNPWKVGDMVLKDRVKLIDYEQKYAFKRLTHDDFGQQIYDIFSRKNQITNHLQDPASRIWV